MSTKKRNMTKRSNTPESPKRYFMQFVLETIWAGFAGAAVGYWHP